MGEAPATLAEAVPSALPRALVEGSQGLAVAWEVSGLGFRAESMGFEVSVERVDRGAFSRLGEFLGLTDRPRPLSLSWEEPGPERPTHVFRSLDLALPDLDPGRYEVTLVLRTSGRSPVESRTRFTVRARR